MFLYLAYQAVHSANMAEYPLQAPQAWVNKFSHIQNAGRRHYAAMIAYMDDCVGRVSRKFPIPYSSNILLVLNFAIYQKACLIRENKNQR